MKIGFLLDDHLHRPGGIQEHVRGLYRYLVSHGHEAVVFTGGGQYDNTFEERVVQLGLSLPIKGSGSWTSVPLSLHTPGALRRLLAHERCDVLDVQSPFSPSLSGRLLAQSRAAHVMTFLIYVDGRLRQRLYQTLALAQRGSLRRFDMRVAVSHSAARAGRLLYGGSDYTIIPDAIDLQAFGAAANRPRPARDHVRLVTVGRLEQRKGVADLLRSYAAVERQHGPAVRLAIAGDGPERAALGRLAAGLGLRQVEFLGYVPRAELPGLLAGADLFCAPASGNESFGRVLIEAMAAGLPIVAAGNAGYAETLRPHPGNLLVPPGDTRAMAGALAAFVTSPAMRAHVGQANRVAAAAYTWEHVGARYVAVYERAIARRAARAGT